jgi:hypothetical protein
MDMFLFARYRRNGGDSSAAQWESSAGVTRWEQAPAPAQVAKRLVEGLFSIELAPSRARLVNKVMHWGYRAKTVVNDLSAHLVYGSPRPPPCGCCHPGTSKEDHV